MHICAMLIDRKYIWLVSFISLRQLHWWMPNILTNTFRISVHKHHHKNHITSMRMVKQRKNVIILCEKIMNLLKNAYFIFYDCVTWWRSHHVHMCCIFNWFCSIMERGIFVTRNEGKPFFARYTLFYQLAENQLLRIESCMKTSINYVFRMMNFSYL